MDKLKEKMDKLNEKLDKLDEKIAQVLGLFYNPNGEIDEWARRLEFMEKPNFSTKHSDNWSQYKDTARAQLMNLNGVIMQGLLPLPKVLALKESESVFDGPAEYVDFATAVKTCLTKEEWQVLFDNVVDGYKKVEKPLDLVRFLERLNLLEFTRGFIGHPKESIHERIPQQFKEFVLEKLSIKKTELSDGKLSIDDAEYINRMLKCCAVMFGNIYVQPQYDNILAETRHKLNDKIEALPNKTKLQRGIKNIGKKVVPSKLPHAIEVVEKTLAKVI